MSLYKREVPFKLLKNVYFFSIAIFLKGLRGLTESNTSINRNLCLRKNISISEGVSNRLRKGSLFINYINTKYDCELLWPLLVFFAFLSLTSLSLNLVHQFGKDKKLKLNKKPKNNVNAIKKNQSNFEKKGKKIK
uniref:Uncharacterized protein n=1 Tax=Glossina brevipalpis TaxID=37001 RepID=A0A1A9WTS0_9MUSC